MMKRFPSSCRQQSRAEHSIAQRTVLYRLYMPDNIEPHGTICREQLCSRLYYTVLSRQLLRPLVARTIDHKHVPRVAVRNISWPHISADCAVRHDVIRHECVVRVAAHKDTATVDLIA